MVGGLRGCLKWWMKRNLLRPLCTTPPPPPPPPPPPRRSPGTILMDFPPVVWPSMIFGCKNWIYTNFIIRPHFDREFNIYGFIEGSKQAVQVISTALSESDFSSLHELVSEDAYAELYHSVSGMSLADREKLAINIDDIYLCFPYQIGIIFDEGDERRWVEITMVYHAFRGFGEMQKGEGESRFRLNDRPDFNKYSICNYRFIREYTKGLTNSSWLVNVVNHFSKEDLERRQR